MEIQELLTTTGEWVLASGLRIALVLILTGLALKIATTLAGRVGGFLTRGDDDEELKKRSTTLVSVTRYALKVTIFLMATMIVLRELGIEIGPILAAAGVVGLAVGFGAQNLVQDVISGFFILLDDQVRVGDVVEVAGKSGLVERVSLRMVVLRDLAGNVHYVRNGQIGVVTNMTKGFSRYVLDIGVAYREDYDEVVGIVRAVDEELRADPDYRDDILEPVEILGLDEFGDSAVVIKARLTTRPIRQWATGREFRRRLKKAFDANGIEIPFPHRTLYMGQDKDGTAPPLSVRVPGSDSKWLDPASTEAADSGTGSSRPADR